MVNRHKQKIKCLVSFLIFLGTIIILYKQMNNNNLQISEIEESQGKTSKIEIKSSALSNENIKLYQKENDNEFLEVTEKEEEQNLFNKSNVFELNTEDKEKPDNVTDIKTSIVNDYIIVDFKEAKDNGTEYEYYLEEDGSKTETTKILSESGIKGYSYAIDNLPNNEAGFTVNKFDSQPILYSNIEWDKDYYLHIRACDNNNNFSESLTYKINLPSKGIRIKYLDMYSNVEISPEETLAGNVNDNYELNNYDKNLDGYSFVKLDGEKTGKLKKERINIKYLYAKKSGIIIRYVNKLTGEEIAPKTYIEGYEGKEYSVKPKNIKGYMYSEHSDNLSGKMLGNEKEITLYYDEIGNVTVSYINEYTGEKIIPDKVVTGIVGNEYDISEKEIPGYELSKKDEKTNGVFASGTNVIKYYYKKAVQLVVKHIDIDTNEILYEETINGYEGDKIIIKSENFEGYILNENFEKSDDNKTKETKNIIDELLEDEEIEEVEEQDEPISILNTIQQYDIVLGSSDTEYIIYYKRK